MEYMSRYNMLRYLEELNSRLAGINRSCDIIMFGGAAMALVHGARDATRANMTLSKRRITKPSRLRN